MSSFKIKYHNNYIMNNNNPFRHAAQIPFPDINNNNNNNRRLALDRQEALNIAHIQRAIEEMRREENAMAPKTPTHKNKRARMSN